jgi:hypothetical protein
MKTLNWGNACYHSAKNLLSIWYLKMWRLKYIKPGAHKSDKNLSNSRYQKGDKNISILRTQNSGVTCKLHCYLVLSVWCMWNDTHLVCRGENSTNCTENIRCHCTKFSHPHAQVEDLYTPLLQQYHILYASLQQKLSKL